MENRKVVATYVLSNVAVVSICYSDSDVVLAGINDDEPEWCEVEYIPTEDGDEFEPIFKLGQLEVPLSECMRINY